MKMNKTSFFIKFTLISAVCSIIGIVHAVSYGPSLVSLTRWDRLSRGPTIFNPDTGRIISLEDYPNFSVVIPLAPDSPSATSNQVFISRRVSGPGEFTVEAPQGYGVMAVVQSLNLRVADDACNDFVLFSEIDGGGGAESTGTCGKVDIRDTSPTPQGLIGPRSFVSASGRMKILFYHGFIWGLVRNFNFDFFDSSLNPDLKVEIAFTAYKDCPSFNETSKEVYDDKETDVNNLFGSCSPNYSDSKTCVRQELFCDGILNCAFSNDFGADEDQTDCLIGKSNVGYFKSQHSPPTTIASTAASASIEATTANIFTDVNVPSFPKSSFSPPTSTLDSVSPISAQLPITEPPTQQEKSTIKHYKGTGTDSAGLIGLVRKFHHVEISKPNKTSKTIVIKTLPSSSEPTVTKTKAYTTSIPTTVAHIINTTSTTALPETTKMPLDGGGELFVDFKSDPIEDSLVDGVSKEETNFHHREFTVSGMSPHTIAGIFAVTVILLILLGALRVYYCYNKVIWNPHGNLKSSETLPEIPNTNLMKKMKAFAAENEDIFSGEKKGKKGLKEQPPSYEILFPLPEEKEGNLKV